MAGINTNLDFKIGLSVEEKGIKLDEFGAKIKGFSNIVKVANSSLKSMTQSIKDMNEVGKKIDFSKSIEKFTKENEKVMSKLKESQELAKKMQSEMAAPKIDVKGSLNSFNSFVAKAKEASSVFGKFSTQATKQTYELGKAMLALNTSTGKFLLSMAAFYSINGAIDIFKEGYIYIFKTAAEFERLQTVLNGLENSATKGKESFEWIKTFAKDTPFTLQETMDAFVRLKGQGLDTNNLKAYGDAAAGMGKNIIQVVEAALDASTGENERLKELGVTAKNLGDKMYYEWTTTSGKGKYAIIENNKKIIESTIAAIFNEKYAGQTDALAKTFNGLASKIKDSFSIMANTLANDSGVFNAFKDVLGDIDKRLSGVANNQKQMNELAKTFADMSIVVLKLAGVFSDFIITAAQTGAVLGAFFSPIAHLLVSAASLVKNFFDSIKNLFDFFTNQTALFIAGIFDLFGAESVGNAIRDWLGFDNITGSLTLLHENFKEDMSDISESFSKFGKSIANSYDILFEDSGIVHQGAKLKATIEKESDKIVVGLENGKNKIGTAQNKIVETFSDFVQDLRNKPISEKDLNQSLIPIISFGEALEFQSKNISKSLKQIQNPINNFKMTPIVQTVGVEFENGATSQTVLKEEKEKQKAADKAKKEAERIRESGLIDYYDVLGDKSRSAYEKMQKYMEGLAKDTKLTKSQLEEVRSKLEDNLKIEEEIANSNKMKDYYEVMGDTANSALEDMNIKMNELRLSGLYTEEQLAKMNERIKEIGVIEQSISSRNTLITYFRNVGNEAKALTLELENDLADIKKSGLYSDQEYAAMKINKEKELAKQIKEVNAKKREEELNQDKNYLIKKGDFEAAKALEMSERKTDLLNRDLSPNQMIEEEKRLVEELDYKYQTLRTNETDRLGQLQAGYNAYMDDLNIRMNDYASISAEVMGSIESSLTSAFTTFFDYSSKSFMDLEELGKSTMKALLEAIMAAITKQLVLITLQTITGTLGSGAGGGGGGTGGGIMSLFGGANKNGNAFSNGSVQAFATGTVIDTPTYFPMSGNKTGLMGEAGPEAIMPLTRDSSGSLGVRVSGGMGRESSTPNITINNYTSSKVEAKSDGNGGITIEVLEDIEKKLAARTVSGNSILDKANNKKYNMQKNY